MFIGDVFAVPIQPYTPGVVWLDEEFFSFVSPLQRGKASKKYSRSCLFPFVCVDTVVHRLVARKRTFGTDSLRYLYLIRNILYQECLQKSLTFPLHCKRL